MSTIESVVGDEQEIGILETVKRFCGFDDLRPLQSQAVGCAISKGRWYPFSGTTRRQTGVLYKKKEEATRVGTWSLWCGKGCNELSGHGD